MRAPPIGAGVSGISPSATAGDNTSRLAAILSYVVDTLGGGTVYIPAGTYDINGNLLTRINEADPVRLTIRGDGPGSSILNLTSDFLGSIFSFRSDEGNAADSYFQVRDLQLETEFGSSVYRRADWFHFYRIENVRFDRVHLTNTFGACIKGFALRNACFTDVHFNRCGTRDFVQPMVVLSPADDTSNKSENIVFDACRWENNLHVGLRLNDTRSVFLLAPKFHGLLSTSLPNVSAPEEVNHVEINNSRGVFITSGRFANCGLAHIVALNGAMLMVNSSSFDGAATGAIDITSCAGAVIVGNNFAAGPTGTPGNNGDIRESDCTATIRKANVPTSVNT